MTQLTVGVVERIDRCAVRIEDSERPVDKRPWFERRVVGDELQTIRGE
ncbi:hypothetical protein ACFSBT_14065 [Halomarina rubra]